MEKKRQLSIGFTEEQITRINNFASKLRVPPTILIREFTMAHITQQSVEELDSKYDFHEYENDIVNAVCQEFYVTKSEMVRQSRKRYIVDARMCVYYLMSKHLGYNNTEIGRIFKKNPSTILHAIREAVILIEVDKHFKTRFDKTMEIINPQVVIKDYI
jgi:chromosomal replication initiation ATPase DnaA